MLKDPFHLQTVVDCPLAKTCSGCQLLGTPYASQITQKIKDLGELLQAHSVSTSRPLSVLSAGESGLRDRLDFTWDRGAFGLYHKTEKSIVDIGECAQLSPALQDWLTDFRRLQLPASKASIRLRVNASGRRGVWLDLANIEIKNLLDEQNYLTSLQELAFVEVGQRRKVPVLSSAGYKLRDPEHHPWFQTWMGDEAVPLYCQVASFTQPSLEANRLIADQIQQWLRQHSNVRVVEFGSGIGNLTFPALAASQSVTACEIDALALEGLETTYQRLPESLPKGDLEVHRGDFQRKIQNDFSRFDLILANPPRSGLMGFVDTLESLSEKQRPEYFIYMSCYPESLAKDLQRLKVWNYEIQELVIVDQFPQTQHYEVLTLLQRK